MLLKQLTQLSNKSCDPSLLSFEAVEAATDVLLTLSGPGLGMLRHRPSLLPRN